MPYVIIKCYIDTQAVDAYDDQPEIAVINLDKLEYLKGLTDAAQSVFIKGGEVTTTPLLKLFFDDKTPKFYQDIYLLKRGQIHNLCNGQMIVVDKLPNGMQQIEVDLCFAAIHTNSQDSISWESYIKDTRYKVITAQFLPFEIF
jgi:hypothetical protein